MQLSLGRDAAKAARPYCNSWHWWFLCFIPGRHDKLTATLAEHAAESGGGLRLVHAHVPGTPPQLFHGRGDEWVEAFHVHFPPGVLWNGAECTPSSSPSRSWTRRPSKAGCSNASATSDPLPGQACSPSALPRRKTRPLTAWGYSATSNEPAARGGRRSLQGAGVDDEARDDGRPPRPVPGGTGRPKPKRGPRGRKGRVI